MKNPLIFRSWPTDYTVRLKQLWWQGKTADECAKILNTSPRYIRERAARESFLRDPAKIKAHNDELLPQPRDDGQFVTIGNCNLSDCLWPYGAPSADMVVCGREAAAGEHWCADHHRIAFQAKKKESE